MPADRTRLMRQIRRTPWAARPRRLPAQAIPVLDHARLPRDTRHAVSAQRGKMSPSTCAACSGSPRCATIQRRQEWDATPEGERSMNRRSFLTLLAGGTILLFGCRRQQQAGNNSASQANTPAAETPAAQTGSSASYELIPVWEMHQVPKYPGSEPGELSPLATQIQNGGTLSFAVPDPADKVLEFYRTALPALGWTLQPAPASAIAAKRGDAALTVVVKGSEHGTTVLLMLTDAA